MYARDHQFTTSRRLCVDVDACALSCLYIKYLSRLYRKGYPVLFARALLRALVRARAGQTAHKWALFFLSFTFYESRYI